MDIPARPKNYRASVLAAIARSDRPVVLMDHVLVLDYSTQGPITQKGVRNCRDFEVTDGGTPILGFHDHPDEMWIGAVYRDLAEERATREAGYGLKAGRGKTESGLLCITTMLQILFLLPFCLVSLVLVVVCSLAPRWRRYVFAALVAPVAFGGCGIVGMFMIVLAAEALGIDQAVGFNGTPASTTLQGWVIPFVSFLLPGAGGAFFAVVIANRLQRF